MKIQQVRFKNLNSLVGEWTIDLMHPAFTSDGIFAITGPTGAGKTTILDAVCLALYGRTPRLTKVTKSGNEIMSRQTGDCFAEVTFETQSGHFRCHWSQHRSRKKADGELQAPKHEIANATTGEIFQSKLRGVADQIVTATGMDFDQFTRSMLLAQGSFAVFLQAAPDERAPILEQITGTEIYSTISIRVHERQREERDQLNILLAETAGIVILDPEQERERRQLLESRQAEESNLTAASTETAQAIAWLTGIDGLHKELAGFAEEAGTLQSAVTAFQPDQERLNRAVSAASLDGIHATLTALRKQQEADQTALTAEEATLPQRESAAREQAELLKEAEHQTATAREELRAAAPLIQRIRSLDQRRAEQQKAVAEAEESCRKDAAKIKEDDLARVTVQGKCSDARQTLERVEEYLTMHARDEWLISGLAGVEEQVAGLRSRQEELVQKEAAHDKAVKSLEQATVSQKNVLQQGDDLKRELDAAVTRLQHGKDELSRMLGGRLLREYRADKESLLREMAFLQKIAELEEHRARLEDGLPCPLCGAIEHPYAEGNVPVADETELKIDALTRLISTAEEQEAVLKKLEAAEVAARTKVMESEQQEITATTTRTAAEIALTDLQESLDKLRTEVAERKEAVVARLVPLGITAIPDDVSSLLMSLTARLNMWQTKGKEKGDSEKQIADYKGEINRLSAVIETQLATLTEKRERLNIIKENLAISGDERQRLYGDRNPDDEERRLNRKVTAAESAEKIARDRHAELQNQWLTTVTRCESLHQRIVQREPEVRKSENEFSGARAAVGFHDEEQFLGARLTAGHQEELTATARKLAERQADLTARQKDRETRLAAERAKQITDLSREELERQSRTQEESLKEVREIVAGLRHTLRENSIAKERIKAKQTAIDAQKRECRRWDNLHELIGSADGKKYRNFAQGLTFEMMIGHANRQLQQMTDRYLLIRNRVQPLELNVIDNYQAGEIRSTKNLSGGESFIVSLSLALGLSHMASKNVRVDSLFLDEGFGTLDEEALDTALETLATLQQDGKLIGVISHVSALKERISTQIQVTPSSGGKSTLSGPGCSRVS